jgi:thiamine biosynthesis lipoprotein
VPPPRLEIDARTVRLILIAFVLLAALSIHRLWFAPLPHGNDVLVLDGETMGTTYQIRVAGGGLTDPLRTEIARETQKRLDDVDRWMSNWNPDSEVSRFNAHRSTEPFPVSFETAEVVAFAVEVTKRTTAAFDITIGPAVRLWGFGHRARLGGGPPTQEELDAVLQHTGGRILRIGRGNPESGGFLIKFSPEVEIDLSALAKGYGVDQVAAGLYSLGREDFLVEIGGEVRASGERPGGGPWRVAVEKPIDEGREIDSVVELRDEAMATSGDYRIFYLEGDRRISHTIDPRTGYPVEGGPASVTTIASSAVVADAWATALMVMGESGLELAASEGIGAMLLMRGEEGEILHLQNELFPKP